MQRVFLFSYQLHGRLGGQLDEAKQTKVATLSYRE